MNEQANEHTGEKSQSEYHVQTLALQQISVFTNFLFSSIPDFNRRRHRCRCSLPLLFFHSSSSFWTNAIHSVRLLELLFLFSISQHKTIHCSNEWEGNKKNATEKHFYFLQSLVLFGLFRLFFVVMDRIGTLLLIRCRCTLINQYNSPRKLNEICKKKRPK